MVTKMCLRKWLNENRCHRTDERHRWHYERSARSQDQWLTDDCCLDAQHEDAWQLLADHQRLPWETLSQGPDQALQHVSAP